MKFVPEVLRTEPQFRLLFGGQVLSIIGDRVMTVALPFAVLAAGGSLTDVGLVVGAQLVPFVVFALVGGAWADRSDRRKVMILSDSVRLLVQATVGALLIAGTATPLALGILAAFYGTADAFFQPAFTGLLPQTLSHAGQIQPANALRSLSFSAASIVAPAVAGILVGALSAGAAFVFDAGTFAVSVFFLLRLRPAVAARETEEAPPPMLRSIREGWRVIRERRWLQAGLGAMCSYHAIVLPSVFVLGPITVAADHGGPGAWAAIVLAFGIGSILGDVLLLRWRPSRALRTAAVALIFASCQAAVYGSGASLPLMCVLQALAGIGVSMFFTLWEASLQEHIPPNALSRVSSYDYLSATALTPISTAAIGSIAAAAGVQTTLLTMTALGIVAALLFLSVRQVRELPRGAGAA